MAIVYTKDGIEDPRRKVPEDPVNVVPHVDQKGKGDDAAMPEQLLTPRQGTGVRRLAEIGIEAIDEKDYKSARRALVKIRDHVPGEEEF